MVKEPRPGRVKTRLARDLGPVGAARWFRREALAALRRLRDPRWELVLAVSPDRAGRASRVWPRGIARLPQGPGDLGRRMAGLFRRLPPGPVLIVGSDIPAMERHHVARAFALLGAADAVFGPARDGGFWLVGLRRTRAQPPGLFRGVRWSGPHALADSLETLPAHRIALADTLRDVDSAADLAALRPPGPDFSPPPRFPE